MAYRIQFKNSYLKLCVHTNSRRIKTIVDNFLDPDVLVLPQDNPCLEIKFFLNERKFKPLPECSHEWQDGQDKVFSVFLQRHRTVEVAIDVKKAEVRANIFEYHEDKKEQILDFILFKPLQCILLKRGYSYLHASAVCRDSKYLLIVGNQNAGKSILALSLLKHGFSLLTDDDCFIKPENDKVLLYPFETKIGIRKEFLKFFPKLQKHLVKNYTYGGKCRLSASALCDNRGFQYYRDCAMIVFPRYLNNKENLKKLSKEETIKRLILQDFPWAGSKEKLGSFWNFYMLARQAPAFELIYNNSNRQKLLDDIVHIFDRTIRK